MTNTFVTGLWDIKRGELPASDEYMWKRSLQTYLEWLEKLLSTGLNFVVFGDDNIKSVVEKYKNARFVYYSVSNFKNDKNYDAVQKIRLSPEWCNQPGAEWLKNSPQAATDMFSILTFHKIKLLKTASELNVFNSERFYWMDSGISRTHSTEIFSILEERLKKYNKFLFFKSKYLTNTEIHGFYRNKIHEYCGVEFVDYVTKAQFFGGDISNLNKIIEKFDELLKETLSSGYLGTEESIYTIMTYKFPELFDFAIMPVNCQNTFIAL